MGKKNILAIGSVALDSVQTPFGNVRDTLGGSAVFFAASARFFSPVTIVAVVGEDFPKKYTALIESLGIPISGIQKEKGKTFRWKGFYNYDLNSAKTLKTELNVFETFKPKISRELQQSPFVFLANIHPDIQMSVLRQVKKPVLTACDTMNYWIESQKKGLLDLLKRIDVFLCNDSEARELSGQFNLIQASRWILSRGPKILVIKKGEHGVLCFSKNFMFLAPAYLLEKVFDPTGAGDSFAGGFVGYLAHAVRLNESVIRRAIIYGSVLASYNVESFSLNRIAKLTRPEIEFRYKAFSKLTRF